MGLITESGKKVALPKELFFKKLTASLALSSSVVIIKFLLLIILTSRALLYLSSTVKILPKVSRIPVNLGLLRILLTLLFKVPLLFKLSLITLILFWFSKYSLLAKLNSFCLLSFFIFDDSSALTNFN